MRKVLLLSVFTITLLFSQVSYNVSLFGQMDKYTGGFADNDYSEVWGWTDTVKNREYAFIGTTYGTSIVDITTSPIKEVSFHIGPPSTYNYQEFRTYKNYLYIGSEGSDVNKNAGIQIVDLSPLPDTSYLKKVYVWVDTTNFSTNATKKYYRAHTVSTEKNFLYVNGGDFGGTRIMDISNPLSPLQIGSYGKANTPYVHDAIIVNDTLYASAINDGRLDIVDLTVKGYYTQSTTAKVISKTPTVSEGRTHQSWLSEDKNYLFVATETGGGYLHVYDIRNKTAPLQIAKWISNTATSIHNVFVKGNFLYVANYKDGFRVLDISKPSNPIEVAFYDTYPNDNASSDLYKGAWGVYPYFPSGKIAVSDMNTGLYVFNVNLKYGGNVIGIVHDAATNTPLGSAQIKILETGRTYSTSAGSGIYEYGNAEGIHHVVFSKSGYTADTLTITTHAGAKDTVNVSLHPVITGMTKNENKPPIVFDLEQNFPNPFNPETTIRFSIEKPNDTSLRIYDVLGNEVSILINHYVDAGSYAINFDAKQLSSGIYFYRLMSGNRNSIKKMIVLK